MGVNKVTLGNNTLIDLTEDTVTPETLVKGVTAHDAAGNLIDGTAALEFYAITLTYSNSKYTSDKTFDEILEAINAGKVVIGFTIGTVYQLSYTNGRSLIQLASIPNAGQTTVLSLNSSNVNSWTQSIVTVKISRVIENAPASYDDYLPTVATVRDYVESKISDVPVEVFVVTYNASISKGDKTFAEITEAYNQGKVCILLQGAFVNYLLSITSSNAVFGRVVGLNYNSTICISNDTWIESSASFANTSNKIDAITDSNKSSTMYWPSNKAITDYIAQQISGSNDSDVLICTVEGTSTDGYTCDYTFIDIQNAEADGKVVLAKYNNSMYFLMQISASYAYFIRSYSTSTSFNVMYGIRITSNNLITSWNARALVTSDRKNTAYDLIEGSSTAHVATGSGVMEMLLAAPEGSADMYDMSVLPNGNIQEYMDWGEKITKFNDDGTITESIYLYQSDKTLEKTYTFATDGSISMNIQWL